MKRPFAGHGIPGNQHSDPLRWEINKTIAVIAQAHYLQKGSRPQAGKGSRLEPGGLPELRRQC